jgi:hypothetical protein
MTKKVLIIGLNYSGDDALSGSINIALSGRINIAVNAREVFIADYGILEENITYLSDEWAPLTKAQIMTAIQTLVSESSMLDELYVYYAGYGSGIRIVKTVDYGEEPLDWVPPSDPLSLSEPLSLPLGSEPLSLDSEPLSLPLGSEPLESLLDSKLWEAKLIESKLWEAKMLESKMLESKMLESGSSDDTITISIDELSNVELSNTELSNLESDPPAEPKSSVEVLELEVLQTPIEPLPEEPLPEIIPTYKYEFYPPSYSYDKLAKQMVGSDYEIIGTTEILGLLSNSRCRTICVLDMCDYKGIATPLMWGTDIIGNVNIISFAESDVVSSGKLATIQVITQHMSV